MTSTISQGLLARFSPSSEFYAITPGDGRVKIWDTLKGQLQVEFTDLAPASSDLLQTKRVTGHLSVDYTCMEWFWLPKKKKNRPGSYLLALGTGSGDVLALDVAGGQLKWKVMDCHSGGVNAVSFSGNSSHIFTAGIDGMVCQINSITGNLIGKFRASTKAISSISLSPDGKLLATAAGQLKIFTCSDYKKIQKFSGHPTDVRCMAFNEDGKYILSSAACEKYITAWKLDGTKNRTACCVLPIEHPVIFLDCKGFDGEPDKDTGFDVLAVSETGLCYFWHGRNIQHLHKNKPTTISLAVPSSVPKYNGSVPAIYSAKLPGNVEPTSGSVLVAYGSILKPRFEKVYVQYGVNVHINWSHDGALLPTIPSHGSQNEHASKIKVTMLDRANAEDALNPFPKICEYQDKKRKHSDHHPVSGIDAEMADTEINQLTLLDKKVSNDSMEEEDAGLCLEDILKSEGIISSKDEIKPEDLDLVPVATVDATTFKNICLQVASSRPNKKMRESALAMFHGDASKLLGVLVFIWKNRSVSEQCVIPWISHMLVNHGHSLVSEQSYREGVNELRKMTMIKCSSFEPLLHLSGRLQLITAQINKSGRGIVHIPSEQPASESDEDEDIDEVVYGEENLTASSDDSDD